MRIAFLYIAEAYQIYHSAAVAHALARVPGVEIINIYNDPDTPHHLERVRRALDAPPIPQMPLRRSPLLRALQAIRLLGMWKRSIMWENRRLLNGFDAVIAVENSVAVLPRLGVTRPKLIYIPHGSGDRARGYIRRIAELDFVLPAGAKTAERMLAEGLIRPGGYAVPGYVKLETAALIAAANAPLFARKRTTVLYNPHKEPTLGSWKRFIEPMLAAFAEQNDFNLIVAPHVKMFRRRSAKLRRSWEARSTDNVLIDTGSDRSVDTSYSTAADIYVGDVSSQLYEFLVEPRPCIFLNAHQIDWRNNLSFRNWKLGEVVDDPNELMPAVRRAKAMHGRYVDAQTELARETLGDRRNGAAQRAADAIIAFLTGTEEHDLFC